MRATLLCCVPLLACSARPSEQASDDESTADDDGLSDTDTHDSGDEPDLPGCDPAVCASECGRGYDDCYLPMIGSCSDADTCVCAMNPRCLPCAEQECGPYENCVGKEFSEYGVCQLPCAHELQYFWARELDCTIALPQDLPPGITDFGFFVSIAGDWIPRTDSCNEPELVESWQLDEQELTITLCGEACSRFESEGELLTGWAIVCE